NEGGIDRAPKLDEGGKEKRQRETRSRKLPRPRHRFSREERRALAPPSAPCNGAPARALPPKGSVPVREVVAHQSSALFRREAGSDPEGPWRPQRASRC